MARPATIFISYSHKDEDYLNQLKSHFSAMRREGLIEPWCDRKITPGAEWATAIDDNLATADLILLLISSDFLASDYCWDKELELAMNRHESGSAQVIPIILRPCDWNSAPFAKCQALPKDGQAITQWDNSDEAFLDVAKGIRTSLQALGASQRGNNTALAKDVPLVWLHGWARYQPSPTEPQPDVQLDLTDYYQKEPSIKLPDLPTWETVIRSKLRALRQQIDTVFATQVLEFRSTCPLSLMLAMGYTFPESGHYELHIKQGPQLWTTRAEPSGNTFKVLQERGESGSDLLVGLAITGDCWSDLENFMQVSAPAFNAVIYAEISTGPGMRSVASTHDAVALAIHAKDLLRRYKQKYQANTLHLVLFCPSGFALFLGHFLSRLGDVIAYEWNGTQYQAGIRLQAN